MSYTMSVQNDLVAYLFSAGVKEIYLFGSQFKDTSTENSDIDIGVLGLAPEKFYRTWADLERIANMRVDLVDFDADTLFFDHLKRTNSLKKIGAA